MIGRSRKTDTAFYCMHFCCFPMPFGGKDQVYRINWKAESSLAALVRDVRASGDGQRGAVVSITSRFSPARNATPWGRLPVCQHWAPI